MKCPICFATIEPVSGEMIHVCPYCDAILISAENHYRVIDRFPWWIKKEIDLKDAAGILITEKNRFTFTFRKRWILNGRFELEYVSDEKAEKNETVTYIYGSLPIFTYPGLKISIKMDGKIKIYHQKGLAVFKPI